MSAIISCTSWKLAIGRSNCSRSFEYSTDAFDAALADADAAGGDAVAAASRARDIAILKPSPTSPSSASSGTSTPSSDELGGVGGPQAELAVDLLRREAGACRSARGSRRGRGASSRDRSGRRSARPSRSCPARSTSSAGDRPAAVGLLGARRAGWRRRSRCRARSGRSSRAPRRSRAAAATPASAPRCPSARSTSRRARSAPTRPCARTSRRGRSPRRSARRCGSRGRGRRTPRARSRRGSPCRRSSCTSSRSKRSLRSFSRARGMISLSAKSRAVSRISRCSSVSSKSIMRGDLEAERAGELGLDVLGMPGRTVLKPIDGSWLRLPGQDELWARVEGGEGCISLVGDGRDGTASAARRGTSSTGAPVCSRLASRAIPHAGRASRARRSPR